VVQIPPLGTVASSDRRFRITRLHCAPSKDWTVSDRHSSLSTSRRVASIANCPLMPLDARRRFGGDEHGATGKRGPCAIKETTTSRRRGTRLLTVRRDIEADFNRLYDEENISVCSGYGLSWRCSLGRAQGRSKLPRRRKSGITTKSAARVPPHRYQPFTSGEDRNEPGRTELPAQRVSADLPVHSHPIEETVEMAPFSVTGADRCGRWFVVRQSCATLARRPL
jgi:hypothetical protein